MKITGATVGTTSPRANWGQTNEKKADYIKNKPNLTQFSNALKGNKSGTVVSANDVSTIEHNLGVKVASKNLLPYPYPDTTKTVNGITFTDNGDGTITATGTATADAYFRLSTLFEVKEGMILSSGTTGDAGDTYEVFVRGTDNTVLYSYSNMGYANHDFFADMVRIRIRAGAVVNGLVFKPKIEYDLSTVKVTRCGKNLIPYPYANTTQTKHGITLIDNGDGTITANGTATDYVFFFVRNKDLILSKGTYFFRGSAPNGSSNTFSAYIVVYDLEGNEIKRYYDTGDGTEINLTLDKQIISVVLLIVSNTTVENLTFCPQIEIGTVATEYEPYIQPQTVTANQDGTVTGLTSLSPNVTLYSDIYGVNINLEYNRDINKAFEEMQQVILSLGGNI